MGDARGCRGGFRRGLRRCRLAPRCRSLCCRLMASALFGMRAAPSRRNGGPRPSSALPLFRCRRARCGVPLRPPVPLLRRLARQRRRAAPPAGSRHPIFFGVVAVGSSGATPPPSPRSPVLLRAAKVGGLASAAFGRRAAAAARPSAPAPPPRFWPRGGAILFSLRRVWGLRRLRAALKVYRAARAAQCKCGVHGFAMNLLRVVTSCNRALLP